MSRLTKITLNIIAVFFALSTLSVAALGIVLSKYSDSRVDPELLNVSQVSAPSEFYCYEYADRYNRTVIGEVLADTASLGAVRYEFIPFSEIPQELSNAFIAIEDKRFYSHNGIDCFRTAHAIANYIVHGRKSFGGSTITQQLVKNLTLDDDFTVQRKIREAFSALDIEEHYSKSEILELYLNVINLSNGCRGIGAASDFYFSKKPLELNLTECAALAAITNNPTKYDPVKHPENNEKRRKTVLYSMRELGMIDDARLKEALSTPLVLKLKQDSAKTEHVNSWYTDMVINDVIRDLSAKYGISRSAASFALYNGGYRIYTAMDPDIQSIVEDYYSCADNFPSDATRGAPQSAMMILDPYTGDILGVAGAVGEKKGNRIQNYATDTLRPPASALKPLSVYALAIERGIADWSTLISDTPVKVTGELWPRNASNTYLGDVTLKVALEESLNTVAVRLLYRVGKENSFNFLKHKLHLYNLCEHTDITESSLALGQPKKGLTLRETLGGYTIFEEGIMSCPRSYFKVTDACGEVILENYGASEKVISVQSAAIMTKLMQSVVKNGTAQGLVSLADKIEVAGKSGTSQGFCDRYFVGYTPQLLGGVWLGYDYPSDLSDLGGNWSVVLWDEVMSRIYCKLGDKYAKAYFAIPPGVKKLKYDPVTGEKASDGTSFDSDRIYEEGYFRVK